ncbi:MAG TPA: hypothetical protein VM243_20915 [Phycisphaerae bacterium]|nr:hypothetical protein [Phycisphaerae bacterium]
MPRDWKGFIRRLLNRPLFGTVVVPRGAVVDAGLFPEDEFPVHCTKCRYLLRGLPDGRCPECGTAFQRGRLLVREYVLKHDEPSFRSSPAGKWTWWLSIGGIALQLAAYGAFLASIFVPEPATPATFQQTADWTTRLFLAWRVVTVIAWLMFIGAGILAARHFYRTRAKRRRIREALNLPKT